MVGYYINILVIFLITFTVVFFFAVYYFENEKYVNSITVHGWERLVLFPISIYENYKKNNFLKINSNIIFFLEVFISSIIVFILLHFTLFFLIMLPVSYTIVIVSDKYIKERGTTQLEYNSVYQYLIRPNLAFENFLTKILLWVKVSEQNCSIIIFIWRTYLSFVLMSNLLTLIYIFVKLIMLLMIIALVIARRF